MNLKTRSIKANLLIYFLVFSALILCFLYIFQILFLNTYYKMNQIRNLNTSIVQIEKKYKKGNAYFDKISINNDVCIKIVKNNKPIYTSDLVKHCFLLNKISTINIEKEFRNSNKNKINIEYIYNNHDGKLLINGKKLDNSTYIFVASSLKPIDRSVDLLKKQFIYVLIMTIILSIIISYLFARRLSRPIVIINKYAKEISKKECLNELNLNTEILELKELETTLNNTVKELKKADATQREFLANVGHDLKTPLTMIEAYANSAKDLNYNNKKKREADLNIIIDEAERLNNLVNDILLLTKIQSSVTKPELKKFNLNIFIREILERFKIYEQEGYNFIFESDKNYNILADKKLLERVVYNLIINATNYTGNDKKVIVSLKDEKNLVRVNITDTGKGISDKEKKLVWNKYFNTDKKYHRNQIGTGLGLSIVKEILDAHGFEYGIDSKKKKGSTFYFKCKIEV